MSFSCKITSLAQTDEDSIYRAFTQAFDNYVIPLEFNQHRTIERWVEAGVDFKHSYGAFDGDELVAFILQVPIEKTFYNFGTGVIPSHRGKHLIQKIYDVIGKNYPDCERYSLEVIRENTPALSLYQKLGFKTMRDLISLRGEFTFIATKEKSFSHDILPLAYSPEMQKIQLAVPAREFSQPVVLRHPERHELHTLKKDGELLAYAIFSPVSMALKELGAGEDSDRYLDQLFLHMKLNGEKFRIMNIDSKAFKLIEYFQQRSLEVFVTQYEMEKILTAT